MIQIDMPMPEYCAKCPCYGLNEFERNRCNITGREFTHNMFDDRAENCPLKEQEHEADNKNTGEWKNGHCSCCGEDVASMLDTWANVQKFLFCPICGANMEER